jgi:DNA-binding beta-propeller fold protein YncE
LTFRTIKIEEGNPGHAAINPKTNIMYMSYPFSNFILVINLTNGSIQEKIATNCPGNIVINNATNKVYAASGEGVYEINGVNNKFVEINTGLHNSSGSVSVNPVTNTVYSWFNSSNSLFVIDALKHSISEVIEVGVTLSGIAINWSDEKIYKPNYESESISVINYKHPGSPTDTINIKQRWDSNEIRNPNLIVLNENSKMLYVQTHVTHGHEGGAVEYEWLYIIYIPTKKTIKKIPLNSNAKKGFLYDPISNELYLRNTNSIVRFDAFGNKKKVIGKINTEYTSIWKRLFGDEYDFLADVIAVNNSTNKVYVSDIKNNLLHEMDS